jgi:signal transduction histidine kinase
VAGLEAVAHGSHGAWGIVVLGSTERFKTRELHERIRLGLTTLFVLALATSVAVVAQRRQRREFELARELAVSHLERERETLLARADKMAAVAALATGIAHEVSTPLNVIVGRVDKVLSRVQAPQTREGLHIVLEQVERIQRIVRSCLALARGDAPELVRRSPNELATRAVDLIRHRFSRAEIELACEVEEHLPMIACEPSLFEQALVNVLLNACQATASGGRVQFRVTRDGERVQFVVDDDGDGISDDVAARAMEPFFSTKHAHGGTGLGLTIAREIVTHHAGSLALTRRRDGGGTRATIVVNLSATTR